MDKSKKDQLVESLLEDAVSTGTAILQMIHTSEKGVVLRRIDPVVMQNPSPDPVDVLKKLVEAIEYTPLGLRALTALNDARRVIAKADELGTTQPVQQPVAWVLFHKGEVAYDRDEPIISNEPGDTLDDSYDWRCVYVAPPAQQAMPEGYRLVPVEPTREMWAASGDAVVRLTNIGIHHDIVSRVVYDAMLAAAPTLPAQQSQWVQELLEALEPFSMLAELFDDSKRGSNMPHEGVIYSWPRPNREYELTVEHLRAARAAIAKALGDSAAPEQAEQSRSINKSVIRDVFLRNGFTIKEGHADLKPYVYAAAEELLSLDGKAVAVEQDAVKVPRELLRRSVSVLENSGDGYYAPQLRALLGGDA